MAPLRHRTVAAEIRYEGDKVRGSRFIATVAPIESEDDVSPRIAAARRDFPAANHHGYAYRLRPGMERFRYDDDGEPSGSAGRPILRQIDARDLTDVVVVVTRIFGGTKLGVGGLIRAYGGAAAAALERAEIREVVAVRRVRLSLPYELTGPVQGLLAEANLTPVASDYGEVVELELEVPVERAEAFLARLVEKTAGRVDVREA